MILRDTNVRRALRSRQRGFLLNPYRFGGGGPATDPNYANVSLLLHGEGANGGTTFTDNSPSPKTPTVVGSVVTSTAQFKYGASSINFVSAGDELQYASGSVFGFGGGDYTLECFFRVAAVTNVNTIFDTRTGGNTGVHFFVGNTAPPLYGTLGASSNTAQIASGGGVSANIWYHAALVRTGTTLLGFIDGTQVFSVTDSRTYASASTLSIGGDFAGSAGQDFVGYLDEARITKGVARYTANFTPPTAAFPDA